METEVEIKSFISKEKYDELIEYFKEAGEFIKEDYQVTYYFDCEDDLRIQKNDYFSKICLKTGKMHEYFRDEMEIIFDRDCFEKLEKFFASAGLNVAIKWFRKRHEFTWEDVKVTVDFTRDYGYIIELEKMCSAQDKESMLKMLRQKLKMLNISLTSMEEFGKRYAEYKKNYSKNLY